MGAAALGVAAAANGVVFGLSILHCLGLFKALRRDLLTVGVLALLYVALWAFSPTALATGSWQPLVFAVYWCAAALVVPSCRQVLHETWLSFRTA